MSASLPFLVKPETKAPARPTGKVQSFYEDYVRHHVPYHESPTGIKGLILRVLPYWSWREWRFWRRYVPKGGRLLDIGCARGREIFVERAGACVGVDIALTALHDCRKHYDLALHAKLASIPFADGSFECVVSSHVIGHVPEAEKDAVLSEVARVLKPGGMSLHVIETDSGHPLVQFAKRRRDLYERFFIDPDGHAGLEAPARVLGRFARLGLRCKRCYRMDVGPFHPRVFLKHFDNEYRQLSRGIDRRARLCGWIMDAPVALAVVEVALGIFHYTLGQWFYGLDRSTFLAVVFEKDAGQQQRHLVQPVRAIMA